MVVYSDDGQYWSLLKISRDCQSRWSVVMVSGAGQWLSVVVFNDDGQ